MASEKGVVVGKLTFTEDGDPIDCSRMGVGGKAIPPNVDKVLPTPWPLPQSSFEMIVIWESTQQHAC